jgi:hypothetical protein
VADVTTSPAGGDYPSPSQGYRVEYFKNGRYKATAWGDAGHRTWQNFGGSIVCTPGTAVLSIPKIGRFLGSLASDTLGALGCADNAR